MTAAILAWVRDEVYYFKVDDDGLSYFTQWRWHWRYDKRGKKPYATRSTQVDGKNRTLYLHVEIHKRRRKRRPSARHVLVDHIDGDTLNCTRDNLRWASHDQNRKNVNGSAKKWYSARAFQRPLAQEKGLCSDGVGPLHCDEAPVSPSTTASR